MRTTRWLLVSMICSLLVLHFACSGDDGNNNNSGIQCSDGKDNDGDGDIDFPADLGCNDETDETEDSGPSPQCDDGRDTDGDGKHDFPNDPGCFAPKQDSEEDDCPNGPNCPECSDGKDNDGNGQTDFPNDSGSCESASDGDEYTHNPVACGAVVPMAVVPHNGEIMGTIDAASPSTLNSMTCGGAGGEKAYELRITEPKVVVATTDDSSTAADTVRYIRGSDCMNASSEIACGCRATAHSTTPACAR